MPLITRPQYLSFADWADQITYELASYGLPQQTNKVENWQQWAFNVVQLPGIAARYPANPLGFSKWSDWAELFLRSVE